MPYFAAADGKIRLQLKFGDQNLFKFVPIVTILCFIPYEDIALNIIRSKDFPGI
jgi:hypothetical protein